MELVTPLDLIIRIISCADDGDAPQSSENAEYPDEEDAGTEDEIADSSDEEISALLTGLPESEHKELLALAWVGNGTFEAGDWDEALTATVATENVSALDQLSDMPMLAAHLEAGLEAFDISSDQANTTG